MRVRDLMQLTYPRVAPTDKIRDAQDTIVRHRGRHAVVVENKRLVGILSEWDVLRAHVRGTINQAVATVMTANVHTVAATDAIDVVMTRFLDERHTTFPVVEDGEPVGLIAVTDVLTALANGGKRPTRKRARRGAVSMSST